MLKERITVEDDDTFTSPKSPPGQRERKYGDLKI
jgi:hypothetical protein